MNILRRLPLSRLLLLCALVVAVGVSASALALAVGSVPIPPAKPLAQAVHDALAGPPVEGVSATITLRNHLLEGANLASDDAATNTLYRYSPPPAERAAAEASEESASEHHEAPSVAKIEEAIAKISKHANVSGATPSDVAGQPAYSVRISPREGGSLFAGAEVSFDAVHGVPLRAAVYSTNSSVPVIELTATAISYGPVDGSVFSFAPPPNAKIVEPVGGAHGGDGASEPGTNRPKVTIRGHGSTAVAGVGNRADGQPACQTRRTSRTT